MSSVRSKQTPRAHPKGARAASAPTIAGGARPARGRTRRTGWLPRRRVDELRVADVPDKNYSSLYPWLTPDGVYDYDYEFCGCGGVSCGECGGQRRWWAEVLPYVSFMAADGLVHVTRAADYKALCGNANMDGFSVAFVDLLKIAARSAGRPVTCVTCMTAERLGDE